MKVITCKRKALNALIVGGCLVPDRTSRTLFGGGAPHDSVGKNLEKMKCKSREFGGETLILCGCKAGTSRGEG